MTIHRIGKKPNIAPSLPERRDWPTGMLYAQIATTRATAREITAAIHARIRTMPSSTNRVMSGSDATSELQASEWATGSRTWRYNGGHLRGDENSLLFFRLVALFFFVVWVFVFSSLRRLC